MTRGQMARLETLMRMQAFLQAKSDALGQLNGSPSRTELDRGIAAIRDLAAEQAAAHTESTSRTKYKYMLRERLRQEHLRQIATIANAGLTSPPAVRGLRLPPGSVSDRALVDVATAMGSLAQQHEDVFTRQGLAADFVVQLHAAVAGFTEALEARDASQAREKGATAGIRYELSRAHDVVGVLNALITKYAARRPELLDGWKHAKRVRAKPGTASGSTAARRAPTETSAAKDDSAP